MTDVETDLAIGIDRLIEPMGWSLNPLARSVYMLDTIQSVQSDMGQHLTLLTNVTWKCHVIGISVLASYEEAMEIVSSINLMSFPTL